MVKKSLLSLGLAAMALTASAQTPVFHEGFNATQEKQDTELGWYEFINTQEGDTRSIVAEGQYEGAGCLQFFNAQSSLCENQGWQRAVKFRNLELKEDTYYKVTFAFKGTNRYNATGENITDADPRCSMRVGLMQGGENSDISILDKAGNDQTKTVDHFNPNEYENYAYTFYFANKATQDEKYLAVAKNDPALVNNYFLTFNVINPGTFYLDDVNFIEVNNLVDAIEYGGFAIRVKFLEDTNIKSLVAKSPIGRVMLPADCATVKVGDRTPAIEAVELHADGYLYIFFAEEEFTSAADGKFLVSFTNPDNIIDLEGDNSRPSFFAFNDVEASFDETGSVKAEEDFYWVPAQVIGAEPADGSFNLDLNINEFAIIFDHNIIPSSVKATLTGKDFSEELAVKAGQETSDKIVLVRTGSGNLAKGMYKITVKNATTAENEIDWSDIQRTYQMSFEVGKVQVAETIFTDLDAKWIEGTYNEAQPTNGWNAYFNGALGTSNANRVGNMVTKDKGVGYYFCQRDASVPAKLTFGEKEEAPLTLPAGNVQFTFWLTQWQGAGGSVDYALYKKADMGEDGTPTEGAVAVVTGSASSTENTSGFGATVDAITGVPVKVENVQAGDYVLVLQQKLGWSGTILYGFDTKTYTVTEGEVNETEILVDGRFADVANGYIPAAGSGWRIHRDGVIRDPGANGGWGGNDTTGGQGGPRMFAVSFKDMAGKGVYLTGSNTVLTYGEFNTYEDAESVEQPEKVLELDEAKYQITYYAAPWKQPGVKLICQIVDQNSGFDGTPIFEKEVTINTPGAAENANATIETTMVQFFWTCPRAGKYILRFHAAGDLMVGNITLETTASMAVQYTNLLKEARKPAVEELEIANSNEDYRGATRDALAKAVEDYEAPDFHTIAEYENAIAELKSLTKAMSTRRDNLAKYPSSLQGILDAMEAAKGTKYERLEAFPIVAECFDTYKDVDYIALSDEDLAEAVAKMGDTGTMMKNMVEKCIPNFVIKQITELAGMITDIDPSLAPKNEDPEGEQDNEETAAKASFASVDATANEEEILLAAGNAISDDQALVAQLKKVYAYKLYEKIAAGENPFEKIVDPGEGYDPYPEATPITADALIQNSIFYTTAFVPAGSSTATTKTTDFPGWNIVVSSGAISPIFSVQWGEAYATPVKPVEDCAVKTTWGTHEYDVNQLINNIPVAKYNVSLVIGEDGTDPHGSYVYVGEGENQVKSEYVGVKNDEGNTSYSRDNSTPQEFENVTAVANGNLGEILLGAHINVAGGFGKVDNAKLTMVAPLEGFDYAAAAQALKEEVVTIIKNTVAPEGEPVKVQYYSVAGTPVAKAAPGQVVIKVAVWKNGFMKVTKSIAK